MMSDSQCCASVHLLYSGCSLQATDKTTTWGSNAMHWGVEVCNFEQCVAVQTACIAFMTELLLRGARSRCQLTRTVAT